MFFRFQSGQNGADVAHEVGALSRLYRVDARLHALVAASGDTFFELEDPGFHQALQIRQARLLRGVVFSEIAELLQGGRFCRRQFAITVQKLLFSCQ